MAINKPTKDFTEFLPNGFGTNSGVAKSDFSTTKKENGFSSQVEDILQGDNLNYMLDNVGKQLKYLTDVVDYITSITANNIPYVDNNDKLTFGDINTFLPSQADNSGKFLTTDGNNNLSWTDAITQIGDPIFTLNFNKVLTSDYIWLDGRELNIADYEDLFAIYGYIYSSYDSGTKFKVPNFNNCTIWGGTTAGKVEAGLPNIKGFVYGSSQISSTNFDNAWNPQTEGVRQNAFTVRGGGVKISNDGEKDNMYNFDASRCSDVYKNSINTVQPPAIKVKAYTRVR